MEEVTILDVATVSAVVAALVTVIGNAFQINKKYRALLAIAVALILTFLPREWANQILMALVIGLTASGVYSQVKPRDHKDDYLRNEVKEQVKKEQNKKINSS